MKVLGVNGSGRGARGNTQIALETLKEAFGAAGVEMEILVLADQELNPCLACYACKQKRRCVQQDGIHALYEKVLAADGLVLASPVYFSNVTSRMAMFIERIGFIARAGDNALAGKVGAAVAVCRRAGANTTFAAMNYFFTIAQMPIASSSYWNVLHGGQPGEVVNDSEGMDTLKTLAANMAEMLKKLRG